MPSTSGAAPSAGRELLSLRQYAAHRRERRLEGHSLYSVQKALRDGRIYRSCSAHGRCPRECAEGGIDPLVADADWERYTVPGARRGPSSGPPSGAPELLQAKIQRETWAARNERLRFEERAGNLVRVDQVQAMLFRKARQVRDALHQLRPRLAPRLALEGDVREVERILDEELRAALESISWDVKRA